MTVLEAIPIVIVNILFMLLCGWIIVLILAKLFELFNK